MVRKAVTALMVAVTAGLLLSACGGSPPAASREAFRTEVLQCPAARLPGGRLPTCRVAPKRLMAYGNQACTWLRSQPTAGDPSDAGSQWTDPYEFGNMTHAFATETADHSVVPLEVAERSVVASMAWQHLCPDLSDRCNVVDVSGD